MKRTLWKTWYSWLGWWQIYMFVGVRWFPLLAVLSGLATVASLLVDPSPPLLSIATVATVLSLAAFASDLWKLVASSDDYYGINLDPSVVGKLTVSPKYRGYSIKHLGGGYVLYDPAVNEILATTPIGISFTKKRRFRIPGVSRVLAPYVMKTRRSRGHILYNEPKVRMVSDLIAHELRSQLTVTLQPTDYFSSVCTNEITSEEFRSKATKSLVYDGFSLMSRSGVILDLSESQCSNHIGVSTLAFTSDMKLVITAQTSGAFVDHNRLVSSGSGSAVPDDLRNARTLQEFAVRAMNRELAEECGLPAETPIRTQLLGYSRFITRGAKPEFFGVSFIGTTAQELSISSRESLYIADLNDILMDAGNHIALASSLQYLRESVSNRSSPDLQTGLLFLTDYISRHPNAFAALAGGQIKDAHGDTYE